MTDRGRNRCVGRDTVSTTFGLDMRKCLVRRMSRRRRPRVKK
jgi:hypothetical protein